MAGLSVLLETQEDLEKKRLVISKVSLMSSHHSFSSPAITKSSFLHQCYLCRKRLLEGMDIYMYRGDKAFCSVECRFRQICMDEEESSRTDNCAATTSAAAAAAAASARKSGRERVLTPGPLYR